MNLAMEQGEFTKRLRARIDADPDLTEAGLATKAGLDNSTVRQLLSGKAKNPRMDTALKICQALGVSLEEFMGAEFDPVQAEILRLLTQLDEPERHALLGAARGLAGKAR